MHVERLPRRLWYRWSQGGAEIEYGNDIPTPPPEIKTNTLQVPVPRTFPTLFQLHATRLDGIPVHPPNALAQIWSWSEAYFIQLQSGGKFYFRIYGTNQFGQQIQAQESFLSYQAGSGFVTPGPNLKPRCDLLVGIDRIINPTVDTPCPTWRFTGGNCPEGSIDCGNCCLDCAAVKSGIEGITASVIPYSIWRQK